MTFYVEGNIAIFQFYCARDVEIRLKSLLGNVTSKKKVMDFGHYYANKYMSLNLIITLWIIIVSEI